MTGYGKQIGTDIGCDMRPCAEKAISVGTTKGGGFVHHYRHMRSIRIE